MSTLDATDQAIIFSLNYLQGKYGKKYSFPSQKTLLKFLIDYHGIKICLRTLNYHLAKLERLHYIYRKRRNPLNRLGSKVYQSTLYSLAKKAYIFLTGLFNTLKPGYYSIKKFLLKKYVSSRKEFEETQRYLSPDENLMRFRELRKKL